MRNEQELAKLALQVQDACNLSGVVHSFSAVMTDLWELSRTVEGRGTAWVNQHPVAKAFASKIESLSGDPDWEALECLSRETTKSS
jgi:hypothetical protein